ncbi:Sec23/Sec24 beta-sandwich domain protein [Cooperia oncophora]
MNRVSRIYGNLLEVFRACGVETIQSSVLFKQTYQRAFDKDANGQLKMGFNATMEVKTGNGLRIEGVLGCCASGNVRNACVSDTEMGIGGTCQWKFCSLTPRTTLCVLFEISAQVR